MLVNFTQLYFATPFRRIEIIPIDIIYLYVQSQFTPDVD